MMTLFYIMAFWLAFLFACHRCAVAYRRSRMEKPTDTETIMKTADGLPSDDILIRLICAKILSGEMKELPRTDEDRAKTTPFIKVKRWGLADERLKLVKESYDDIGVWSTTYCVIYDGRRIKVNDTQRKEIDKAFDTLRRRLVTKSIEESKAEQKKLVDDAIKYIVSVDSVENRKKC